MSDHYHTSGMNPLKNTEYQDREQVCAGLALLRTSRLVMWDATKRKLRPVAEQEFEAAQASIDPVYGRFISWILFSTGAELLAKGVCLVRGVDVSSMRPLPDRPPDPLTEAWMNLLVRGKAPESPKRVFGELGRLTENNGYLKETKTNGYLTQLCGEVGASSDDKLHLLAAYTYLQKAIRNRDVHGYLKDVRGSDFPLVANLFLSPLNLLISWLPPDCGWEREAHAPGPPN